jgi:hypothetical protein
MVLNDKSGIDGENLTVEVKLNAVTCPHISLLSQVGNQLILEPTNRNESRRIVRDEVLRINRTLEDTAILVDAVLRVRDYRDPLPSI